MNVLIVSRKQPTRALVRAALDPDVIFEDADDGLAALERAREGGLDLVIADETTEPYGAFGLTRELKLLADPPRVIVLLERTQDAWLARWSGADHWLLQPVDPFQLGGAARSSVQSPRATAAAAEPVVG